jgi:hypothetical protein
MDAIAAHCRRRFLKSLAASALIPAGSGFSGIGALIAHARETRPNRFGRMFPYLAPFAHPSDRVMHALFEMGRPGGIMDAKDDLGRGPADLISDPALNLKQSE